MLPSNFEKNEINENSCKNRWFRSKIYDSNRFLRFGLTSSALRSKWHQESKNALHNTQYAIRTPCIGDFFRICPPFCITVRIMINEFVYRMWYVVFWMKNGGSWWKTSTIRHCEAWRAVAIFSVMYRKSIAWFEIASRSLSWAKSKGA